METGETETEAWVRQVHEWHDDTVITRAEPRVTKHVSGDNGGLLSSILGLASRSFNQFLSLVSKQALVNQALEEFQERNAHDWSIALHPGSPVRDSGSQQRDADGEDAQAPQTARLAIAAREAVEVYEVRGSHLHLTAHADLPRDEHCGRRLLRWSDDGTALAIVLSNGIMYIFAAEDLAARARTDLLAHHTDVPPAYRSPSTATAPQVADVVLLPSHTWQGHRLHAACVLLSNGGVFVSEQPETLSANATSTSSSTTSSSSSSRKQDGLATSCGYHLAYVSLLVHVPLSNLVCVLGQTRAGHAAVVGYRCVQALGSDAAPHLSLQPVDALAGKVLVRASGSDAYGMAAVAADVSSQGDRIVVALLNGGIVVARLPSFAVECTIPWSSLATLETRTAPHPLLPDSEAVRADRLSSLRWWSKTRVVVAFAGGDVALVDVPVQQGEDTASTTRSNNVVNRLTQRVPLFGRAPLVTPALVLQRANDQRGENGGQEAEGEGQGIDVLVWVLQEQVEERSDGDAERNRNSSDGSGPAGQQGEGGTVTQSILQLLSTVLGQAVPSLHRTTSSYRLTHVRQLPPAKLLDELIALQEYGQARELAERHDLDVDIVFRAMWRAEGVNRFTVKDYLARMQDTPWVLREIASYRVEDMDAALEMCELGLQRTAFSSVFPDAASPDSVTAETMTAAQQQHLLLRRHILLRFDRLRMFRFFLEAEAGLAFDPDAYALFETDHLPTQAAILACDARVQCLRGLLVRHQHHLQPAIYGLLALLPPTTPLKAWLPLLPSCARNEDEQQQHQESERTQLVMPKHKPWREEEDWCERVSYRPTSDSTSAMSDEIDEASLQASTLLLEAADRASGAVLHPLAAVLRECAQAQRAAGSSTRDSDDDDDDEEGDGDEEVRNDAGVVPLQASVAAGRALIWHKARQLCAMQETGRAVQLVGEAMARNYPGLDSLMGHVQTLETLVRDCHYTPTTAALGDENAADGEEGTGGRQLTLEHVQVMPMQEVVRIMFDIDGALAATADTWQQQQQQQQQQSQPAREQEVMADRCKFVIAPLLRRTRDRSGDKGDDSRLREDAFVGVRDALRDIAAAHPARAITVVKNTQDDATSAAASSASPASLLASMVPDSQQRSAVLRAAIHALSDKPGSSELCERLLAMLETVDAEAADHLSPRCLCFIVACKHEPTAMADLEHLHHQAQHHRGTTRSTSEKEGVQQQERQEGKDVDHESESGGSEHGDDDYDNYLDDQGANEASTHLGQGGLRGQAPMEKGSSSSRSSSGDDRRGSDSVVECEQFVARLLRIGARRAKTSDHWQALLEDAFVVQRYLHAGVSVRSMLQEYMRVSLTADDDAALAAVMPFFAVTRQGRGHGGSTQAASVSRNPTSASATTAPSAPASSSSSSSFRQRISAIGQVSPGGVAGALRQLLGPSRSLLRSRHQRQGATAAAVGGDVAVGARGARDHGLEGEAGACGSECLQALAGELTQDDVVEAALSAVRELVNSALDVAGTGTTLSSSNPLAGKKGASSSGSGSSLDKAWRILNLLPADTPAVAEERRFLEACALLARLNIKMSPLQLRLLPPLSVICKMLDSGSVSLRDFDSVSRFIDLRTSTEDEAVALAAQAREVFVRQALDKQDVALALKHLRPLLSLAHDQPSTETLTQLCARCVDLVLCTTSTPPWSAALSAVHADVVNAALFAVQHCGDTAIEWHFDALKCLLNAAQRSAAANRTQQPVSGRRKDTAEAMEGEEDEKEEAEEAEGQAEEFVPGHDTPKHALMEMDNASSPASSDTAVMAAAATLLSSVTQAAHASLTSMTSAGPGMDSGGASKDRRLQETLSKCTALTCPQPTLLVKDVAPALPGESGAALDGVAAAFDTLHARVERAWAKRMHEDDSTAAEGGTARCSTHAVSLSSTQLPEAAVAVDDALVECAHVALPVDVRLGLSCLLACRDVGRAVVAFKTRYGDAFALIKTFVALRLAAMRERSKAQTARYATLSELFAFAQSVVEAAGGEEGRDEDGGGASGTGGSAKEANESGDGSTIAGDGPGGDGLSEKQDMQGKAEEEEEEGLDNRQRHGKGGEDGEDEEKKKPNTGDAPAAAAARDERAALVGLWRWCLREQHNAHMAQRLVHLEDHVDRRRFMHDASYRVSCVQGMARGTRDPDRLQRAVTLAHEFDIPLFVIHAAHVRAVFMRAEPRLAHLQAPVGDVCAALAERPVDARELLRTVWERSSYTSMDAVGAFMHLCATFEAMVAEKDLTRDDTGSVTAPVFETPASMHVEAVSALKNAGVDIAYKRIVSPKEDESAEGAVAAVVNRENMHVLRQFLPSVTTLTAIDIVVRAAAFEVSGAPTPDLAPHDPLPDQWTTALGEALSLLAEASPVDLEKFLELSGSGEWPRAYVVYALKAILELARKRPEAHHAASAAAIERMEQRLKERTAQPQMQVSHRLAQLDPDLEDMFLSCTTAEETYALAVRVIATQSAFEVADALLQNDDVRGLQDAVSNAVWSLISTVAPSAASEMSACVRRDLERVPLDCDEPARALQAMVERLAAASGGAGMEEWSTSPRRVLRQAIRDMRAYVTQGDTTAVELPLKLQAAKLLRAHQQTSEQQDGLGEDLESDDDSDDSDDEEGREEGEDRTAAGSDGDGVLARIIGRMEVAKHMHEVLGVDPSVLHKADAVSVVQLVLAEAGSSTDRFLLGPALLNTWHRAFVLAGNGGADDEDSAGWAKRSLCSAWELLCKMAIVHDAQGRTFLLLCAYRAKYAHHHLDEGAVERAVGNLRDKQPLHATAWLLANGRGPEAWQGLQPREDSRHSRRVLTFIACKLRLVPTLLGSWLYVRVRDTIVDAVQQNDTTLLPQVDASVKVNVDDLCLQLQAAGQEEAAQDLRRRCNEDPNSGSAFASVMGFFS